MQINLFNFKKIILLIFLFQLFSGSLKSNPGDTTWVTIYNQRKLTYYGNYDTTSSLPSGVRYRKIRLHYILGRYACPNGTQYCGSWDYTTQIYAKPPNSDTVEIARVITPYATDWLAQNRKHDYVIDVTDYASVLTGPMGFKFGYQGYSFGFTNTLKLEMIEGVPPMDALKVKNIYDGYFQYGNNANSIENYLTAKTLSYAPPATKAFIKNSVSGHGSDDAQCSEFCSKYYQLKLNNSQIAQNQLWRSDCGSNQVYPQTGTWLYQRANWCPGSVVWPIYHDISALTAANASFTADVDMQPYSAPNQANINAGYNFVSQLITYSVVNHSLDVSIEDIVAPTSDDNYFRNNQTCTNPIIKIKNVGTNTITQVVFNYGLSGSPPLTYTWTGSLNFLSETDVTFPPSLSVFTNNISSAFQVSVTSVNGVSDQNVYNNVYNSVTGPVSVFPSNFVVRFFTNNATDPNTSKNETSWKLYNESGALINSRTNINNLTYLVDTLNLQPGCYKFVVDDAGCDGYKWWAYQYYTPDPGFGSLDFAYINANNVIYDFNGDFGCGVTKYFRIANNITPVKANSVRENIVEVYPNPATNEAYIKFDLQQQQNVNYKIFDVAGKIIGQKNLRGILASYQTIDISQIANGTYFVTIELENGLRVNKKLIIQR
jgi:hypothetical protein